MLCGQNYEDAVDVFVPPLVAAHWLPPFVAPFVADCTYVQYICVYVTPTHWSVNAAPGRPGPTKLCVLLVSFGGSCHILRSPLIVVL